MTATSSRCAAAAALVVALIAQTAWMGRAVVGLDVGLVAAFAFWAGRAPIAAPERAALARLFAAGIAMQVLHFGEELSTGFARALPGLFGYAWSDARFVAFNLVWLAIFAGAALALRRGAHAAGLVLWFFALVGGLGNGVLHVALAVAQGGYFPGLLTAPLLFAVGVALLRRLMAATRRRGAA